MKKNLHKLLFLTFVIAFAFILAPNVQAASANVTSDMSNEEIQALVNANDEIIFAGGTYQDIHFTVTSEKTFVALADVIFLGNGQTGVAEGESNVGIILLDTGAITFNGPGTITFKNYQNGVRVKGTNNTLNINTPTTITESLAYGRVGWAGNGIYANGTNGNFTINVNATTFNVDNNGGAGMIFYNKVTTVINVTNGGTLSTSGNKGFDGIYAHEGKTTTLNVTNSTLTMNGNGANGFTSVMNGYIYLTNSTMNTCSNKGAGGINNGHVVAYYSTINANDNSYHGLTNISLSTFDSTVIANNNGNRGININAGLASVADGLTMIDHSNFHVTNNGNSGIYFLNANGTKITNSSDITTTGNGTKTATSTFSGDGIVASYQVSIDNSYLTSIDPHSLATSATSASPSTVYIKEYTVYVAEGTGEVDPDVVDDYNSKHPEYLGTIVITGGSFQASNDVTVDNHEDYVETKEDVTSTVSIVNDHNEDLYRFTLTTDNKEVGGAGNHEFNYQYHDSDDSLTYKFIYDQNDKAYVWTPISLLYYNPTEGVMDITSSTAKLYYGFGKDITIYGNSLNLAEKLIATATRENYVFAGWYIADDQELAAKYAEEENWEALYALLNIPFTDSTKLMLEGKAVDELTVYAKWEEESIGSTDGWEIIPPKTGIETNSTTQQSILLILLLLGNMATVYYLKKN